MNFDDEERFEGMERLVSVLHEQGMDADEIATTMPVLHLLPDWQAPRPTPAMREALLAKLVAQQSMAPAAAVAVVERKAAMLRLLLWNWQIAMRQFRLIHRSVWIGATACVVAVTIVGLLSWDFWGSRQPGSVLEIFLPLISAVSAAFLYGPEADMGLEVTRATQVSPRFVVACRLIMLCGYELLLGLVATGMLAHADHIGFGELAQLWLGPVALLSACSLLFSLLIGPVVTVTSLCLAWLAQFVQFSGTTFGSISTIPSWTNQPFVFVLAAIVLCGVFVAVSRLEPNTNNQGME